MTGLQIGMVSFGTPMPKTGIQKFKAKKGEQYIKILSIDDGCCFAFRTHYIEGIGSFHCFSPDGSGDCCKDASLSPNGSTQERFILPIAIYTPSFTGGVSVDFAYLPLPENKYSALLSLHNSSGNITTYDIKIDCEDEAFQKYSFIPVINKPPMIDSIPNIQKDIDNFLSDYKANIEKSVAPKKFTPITYMQAKTEALQKTANNVGANFTPNASAMNTFNQQNVALPKQVVTPQITVAKPVETAVIPQVVVSQPNENLTTQVNPIPAVQTTQANVTEQVVQAEPPAQVVESPDGIDWSSMMNND